MTDTRELAREFDQLWEVFPRAEKRPQAHLQFLIARKHGATLAQMLEALEWQRQQPGWIKDGGAYVPSLVTWLKDERWLDKPPQVPQVKERTARSLAAVEQWTKRA